MSGGAIPRRALLLAVALQGLSACALLRPAPPRYEPVLLPSGVLVQDLVVPPEGPSARDGDRVRLHYRIALADGTVVDSSFDRGQPLEVVLGDGLLPPGLEEGVLGLRLYGRRRVVVPAALGFGAQGHPPRVPPGAELHCLLELMALQLGP